MTKKNMTTTTTKLFGREIVFAHRYYVVEELLNGKQIRVSKSFAFQADAAAVAKEMARRDHGRGGKFLVIVAN